MNGVRAEIGGDVFTFFEDLHHPVAEAGGLVGARFGSSDGRHVGFEPNSGDRLFSPDTAEKANPIRQMVVTKLPSECRFS